MVAVLALTGAALFVTTGLALAARIVHIGNLDAMALAAKLAMPHPASAMDWPELEIRAVVPQPGDPSLVLLLVGRRRSDNEAATRWSSSAAHVTTRCGGCPAGAIPVRR